MKFRPCIDIHNGKVKQIVGGSLTDEKDQAQENFVCEQDAAWFARLYQKDGLKGGHVILLNAVDSPYFPQTKEQALLALQAYPGGLQLGGGVNALNAAEYLNAGASHVIVTSYVFEGGHIRYDRLLELERAVGKHRLVLDVSCRRGADGGYYVVTDRWQTYTKERVTKELLLELSAWCDEFLVHGVDSEGKRQGLELDLVRILAGFDSCPVTYAGGVSNLEDLNRLNEIGHGKLDVTIGSALDLFGGSLSYRELVKQTAAVE